MKLLLEYPLIAKEDIIRLIDEYEEVKSTDKELAENKHKEILAIIWNFIKFYIERECWINPVFLLSDIKKLDNKDTDIDLWPNPDEIYRILVHLPKDISIKLLKQCYSHGDINYAYQLEDSLRDFTYFKEVLYKKNFSYLAHACKIYLDIYNRQRLMIEYTRRMGYILGAAAEAVKEYVPEYASLYGVSTEEAHKILAEELFNRMISDEEYKEISLPPSSEIISNNTQIPVYFSETITSSAIMAAEAVKEVLDPYGIFDSNFTTIYQVVETLLYYIFTKIHKRCIRIEMLKEMLSIFAIHPVLKKYYNNIAEKYNNIMKEFNNQDDDDEEDYSIDYHFSNIDELKPEDYEQIISKAQYFELPDIGTIDNSEEESAEREEIIEEEQPLPESIDPPLFKLRRDKDYYIKNEDPNDCYDAAEDPELPNDYAEYSCNTDPDDYFVITYGINAMEITKKQIEYLYLELCERGYLYKNQNQLNLFAYRLTGRQVPDLRYGHIIWKVDKTHKKKELIAFIYTFFTDPTIQTAPYNKGNKFFVYKDEKNNVIEAYGGRSLKSGEENDEYEERYKRIAESFKKEA